MSSTHFSPSRVAVIGAGIAGASCAASLRQAGLAVTLFDKARGVGGRMAARRAEWQGADGSAHETEFDHGAQHIQTRHPRFAAALRRAAAAGVVHAWRPKVHAAWPATTQRESWVPEGRMSALVRHVIADAPVHLNFQVQRLQRGPGGWQVVAVDGTSVGPFDQVMLAMPPAQAAVLLAGHHDEWADTLAAVRMQPCWTLMAVTQDVDWPWDACEPEPSRNSPLAWVARNDRKPGRQGVLGQASWVAHASAEWTQAHLEATPAAVQAAMSQALATLLPTASGSDKLQWHHRAVHRWRYAASAVSLGVECWWDARRGLGVCGDFMGSQATWQGGVEAAWRSGDELADTLLAALDEDMTLVEEAAAEAPAHHDERDLAHAS